MITSRYLTTEEYAARLGVSPTTLRRKANAGEIPGAVRVSGDRGAWRFLDPDTSTAPAPRGVGAVSAGTGDRLAVHLMSPQRSTPASHVAAAIRVSSQLAAVTTRPARAAQAMLAPLVSVASRHTANRDGWCSACGWQHPCADFIDATTGLDAASTTVLDGAA